MWSQGQSHHPYTLLFLGTWEHGDTSLGHIDMETGTGTPPLYTFLSGDVGTRGHFSRIYRCGDRDRHTTPTHSHFGDLGTRGHFSRIYRCGDRDRHTIPIHSHFWGRGDTGTLL